jgi:hypothetical protein
MGDAKPHDLYDFMREISAEISLEYSRIQKRATEDPGTAGDQGEENWAQILREWLPRTFEVVTKGRIISEDGRTGPQVDVLVLDAAYPKKLLNRKLYLAAGVAAAFECKTTLKASHIHDAVNNCVAIKSLYPERLGTPYRELYAPIVYGLLAHSHSWKAENSTPDLNIEEKLYNEDRALVSHPRFQLDHLCVADLATWSVSKTTFVRPFKLESGEWFQGFGQNGSAVTGFLGHTKAQEQVEHFTPVGALIATLMRRLAWERPELRAIADYYRVAQISGIAKGVTRLWDSTIYSDKIRIDVEAGDRLANPATWDEWNMAFC